MTIRFGIIGVGYFGKHYVRLLQEMEGAELVGIVTRPGIEILKLPKTIKKYESADALLCDSAIDCVIIATPPSSHAELAITAFQKGKHVLIEKPMASSLREAHVIADAAHASGRICMIGHQYCHNDYIRQLKKEIEQKTIGDIKYIFAEHLYIGPVRLDVGCFWETATHELAIIDYLFGHVSAIKITGQMVDIMGSGRDDAANATIAFDNGVVVSIVTSWFAPQKVRRMTIVGTKGMAVFDEKETHPLVLFRHAYPEQESPELHTSHFFEIKEEEKYIPHIDAHEPLRNQLSHFIDCIIKKKTPITGVDQGLRITKLLDEITTRMRD